MTRAACSPFALAVAVGVALLVAWGGLYVARTSFELDDGRRVFTLWDDGMISMTYARNLARGDGLVWNPGEEPVQGFSNPGVTLVMAAIHLLPLAPRHTALVFQLVCLALLVAVVLLSGRIARGFCRDPGEASAVALSAGLAVATCATLAVWSLQGSDAAFVTAWLLACMALLQRSEQTGEPWPPGLFALLAVGPVIRPDSVVFVAVFGAAALVMPGVPMRRVVAGGLGIGAVGLAMLAANVAYYGDPLPNTFYLKATGAGLGERLASGLGQLGALSPLALTLPVLAAVGAARSRTPAALTSAALCVVAFLYHLWVGGDWAPNLGSRFLASVLPLAAALAANGAFALSAPVPAGRARALVAGAACVLATTAASPLRALQDWFDPGTTPVMRAYNRHNVELGLYLREHTDPDTTIGVHFGGVPPYFSERPAVDVWGKSDRHIARTPAHSPFRPGHAKWDWPYVVDQRRPDVLLAEAGPDRSPRLKRLRSFRRSYLRVHDGEGRFLFFARREALGRLHDPDLRFHDPITGEVVARPEAASPAPEEPSPRPEETSPGSGSRPTPSAVGPSPRTRRGG